jgi:hypothetical protein
MPHKTEYVIYRFSIYEFQFYKVQINENESAKEYKHFRLFTINKQYEKADELFDQDAYFNRTDVLQIIVGLIIAAYEQDYAFVLENISIVRNELRMKLNHMQYLFFKKLLKYETYRSYARKYSDLYSAFDIVDDLEKHIIIKTQLILSRKRTISSKLRKTTSNMFNGVRKMFANKK